MIKTKKQMFIVIGAFALVMLLGTVTYAFFNYTRTGTANVIRTGQINFTTTQTSGQNGAISLTNVFPVDVSEGIPANDPNVGEVTINITGNTEYTGGIEYLVSATNVTNTVGDKVIPIGVNVTATSGLGTSDTDYYVDRENNPGTSIYKVLASDSIESNTDLLVGYIKSGQTGVNGNIVIKAYIDASKVAISDTYYGNVTATPTPTAPTDEYGTPASFGEGKVVLTTTEWNSLRTNGVSFQVKVEANENVWVEEVRSVNAMIEFTTAITDYKTNIKEVYFNKLGPTAMQNAYDAATIKADLTANNEGKVLAWLEPNPDDNTKYNLIVASDGDTYYLGGFNAFKDFVSMEKIEFNNFNTSRVSIMANWFENCSSLTSLDLSSFVTTNVQGFAYMFKGCTNLVVLDISNFDVSNQFSGSLSNMFQNCTSLTTIYVASDWDASNQPEGMPIFSGCTSLVGTSPNGTTYAFTDYNTTDKTYAVIATDSTPGYLTDVSLKPTD